MSLCLLPPSASFEYSSSACPAGVNGVFSALPVKLMPISFPTSRKRFTLNKEDLRC